MGRGFGITSAVDADVVREVAQEAERLGYTSFWVNDMPHADGLAALAVASTATSRIQVGVGVLPLDQRPAEDIAEQVRSHRLPEDRLLLGVGSGDAQGGLARVRAGVDALGLQLRSRIVVGALGPKMAALGGETSAGVLLNWLTPSYAQRIGSGVLDAAERAGRPRPSLLAYVRCGLLPAAEARLEAELGRYAGLAQFERHVERMAADALDTCVLGADGAALQAGIAPYEAVLDETIVRAITPDDGRDSLVALVHACAPGRTTG